MPRRSLPVAMTDHASTQAPKKKRRAARKIASTAARKRTKAKTKAYQRCNPAALTASRPAPSSIADLRRTIAANRFQRDRDRFAAPDQESIRSANYRARVGNRGRRRL